MTQSLPVSANEPILAPGGAEKASRGKVYFHVSASDWKWDIIFMLSLVLVGLWMPLGHLLVIALLVREYTVCRESFVVKLMLVIGGYSITMPHIQWGVNLQFIIVPLSLLAMCFLRKTPLLRKSIIVYAAFAVVTVFMAWKWGVEGFGTQFRLILKYLSFCVFALFIISFNGSKFDMRRLWERTYTIMMIICVFYILDGYLLGGWVFIPQSYVDGANSPSTFLNPYMYGFGVFPRKYQVTLYPMALLIYPLVKHYKLRWWEWALILAALGASRTTTVIIACVVGILMCQGSLKKYLGYVIGVVVLFTAVYFVDDSMGYDETSGSSTMRISSTINQFFDLSEVEDDEDLAEAGTGRIGQLLPTLDQMYSDGRQWVGYGFVPTNTENARATVYNEFEPNPLKRVRAVTDIEIDQMRVFLQGGYIGLALYIIFYFGLYFLIRRVRYGFYYLSVLTVCFVFSVGTGEGLSSVALISIVALAYAGALLDHQKPLAEEN